MFKECNCPHCRQLLEIHTVVEVKQYEGCPVDNKITALCPNCGETFCFKK